MFEGRSTRLTHYWSNKFFNSYKKRINEYKPAIIYVDNLLMMQYPLKYKLNAKIWFYDDESNLFIRENGLRKNLIEKFRNIGLCKFEETSIRASERIFCITKEETQHLNYLGFKNVHALPYPVDEKYFYYNWTYPQKGISILFVGDFAHHPNKEAARVICEDIYPLLKSNGAKITLVGRNFIRIKKYLKKEISTFENVEDVRPFYWGNSIFVTPIFSGGGMRIKILEAAACGIPIIMTPLANLGINFEHMKEAIILNTIAEIVKFIKSSHISNSTELIKLSKMANQKIKTDFSLEKMKVFYASQFSN